ncbi:hypothetical protein AQUCO_01700596v1 [Aquilegia coerulea]|uniref:Pentacotripeptide-repeat region of PRORP domain-containing protein n=1 Tax=Aquilegia coerulea TaxID=218851 RepID=A0A2G5DNV0_AQUCA|nr:hypothetical protein AQUCO_01700596v1 [Aquilegia coerulea]PIA45169.1 hypothetical protein AQUCO_01700596v1 [Aquilegia coerulea]
MLRYIFSRRLFTSASTASRISWDPTLSLDLSHPTLVLLEKCRTRDHFKQILGQMIRIQLASQTFPMSRLLFFSAISHPENIDLAILLFNYHTFPPNLYIYNIMISALSFSSTQSVSLYNSMLHLHIYPDKHTLLFLLKATKSLSQGKQIHSHVITTGLMSYGYLQNSLIKMYTEYGDMNLAHQVLQQMPLQDAVSFNTMISGYARKGHFLEALQLYHEMVVTGINPDEFTMVSLLISCGHLGDKRLGKSIHAWIERRKLYGGRNLILGNALLDMYVKSEDLKLAERLFGAFTERDVISWNTIIAGYAKSGELEIATSLFDEMPKRDIVSWNSLISGYAQKRDWSALMNSFRVMVEENVRPDNITIVTLVCAAAEVGGLYLGRLIHGWVIRSHMKIDAFLASALIDMYCKCGSIEKALMIFNGVCEKDVAVWTAMIAGFAFHGYGSRAMELFHEMQEIRMPNQVTFVAVLSACSHGGLVDQGLKVFNSMKMYGIEPRVEHYGCLVDLLARAGKVSEAKSVIEKMPMKPSGSIWGAMLNVSKAHGNVELAETALTELLKLEPEKEGGYVLLSNIYAACGRWSYSHKIRDIMESRGVKKIAGCSSVVIDGVTHNFVAADKRHSRCVEIYFILNILKREMKPDADIFL